MKARGHLRRRGSRAATIFTRGANPGTRSELRKHPERPLFRSSVSGTRPQPSRAEWVEPGGKYE